MLPKSFFLLFDKIENILICVMAMVLSARESLQQVIANLSDED
jgi:hypothetical protein